jgi:hypothetical protein
MTKYSIKPYQEGFDKEQAHIGLEVAKSWLWPLVHDEQDLKQIHTQANFDPETSWYCFDGNRMVGFISMSVYPSNSADNTKALLFFPRCLPGYEQASDLLIGHSLDVLRRKDFRKVETQVTTMIENSAALLEGCGFSPSQDRGWGYKVYYSYNMDQGELNVDAAHVYEVSTAGEYDESVELATIWYKKPKEWCKNHLDEWHATGEVITHPFIRYDGRMVASCMAAPNTVRKDTAAMYFVYVKGAEYLPPLLSRVVHGCIQKGCKTLIADLVNEHRGYGDIYQSLGFVKTADWAVYEKEL